MMMDKVETNKRRQVKLLNESKHRRATVNYEIEVR
jgi:hypothetical protein